MNSLVASRMPEGIHTVTTSIILLGLVVIWGAYLAVWWRDNRGSLMRSPDMIDSFSRQLGSLGGSAGSDGSTLGSPSGTLCPQSCQEAARRRRLVLSSLGGLAIVTLALTFVFGASALLANIVVDSVLAWYGFAVIQRRNNAAEREMKVTMLRAVPAQEQLQSRQSVNA